MIENERVLHDVAGALMDGAPIDWASAESKADNESMRRILRELKVIAAIADVHGTSAVSSDSPSVDAEAGNLSSGQQPRDSAGAESPAQVHGTWGALRLLEKIGEGAFGEVHRAWDTRLDREVALKLLYRQDTPRAREASAVIDEGRMLAQVRHPNVVTVHGADRCDGRVGVWTEFIHGRTLEQLLQERGAFGAGEATLIGLDVCRALSAVHRAGLLHRDIKAHNVMREHGGRIVLMDFGTGIHYVDSNDSTAGLAGTPLYMAPEVLEGREATVRSDVYSVGVLLYHLVTGSYPIRGHSVQEVRAKHSQGERTFLRDARPDLPDDFVQIVERALSPEPERRYESAGAMEAALASAKEAARSIGATTARGAVVTPAVDRTLPLESVERTRWRPRILAIAAVLVVLAGAGSLWLAARKSDPPVIAVLPFKNLSAEPDSDYFVDGLTDEVIRNLSVIDGLFVRSSASSFAFKNKNPSARDVSAQLNASLVLSASVLRAGTRLRIDAQLVRAADDLPLWSARYHRELKDVFAIQDEISRSIVNELRLKLGRGQRRYTANVEVYDRYLKARVLQARRGPGHSPGDRAVRTGRGEGSGLCPGLRGDVPARTDTTWPCRFRASAAYPSPWIRHTGSSAAMRSRRFSSIPCSPKPMTRSAGSIRSISNGPRPRSPSAMPSNSTRASRLHPRISCSRRSSRKGNWAKRYASWTMRSTQILCQRTCDGRCRWCRSAPGNTTPRSTIAAARLNWILNCLPRTPGASRR